MKSRQEVLELLALLHHLREEGVLKRGILVNLP